MGPVCLIWGTKRLHVGLGGRKGKTIENTENT